MVRLFILLIFVQVVCAALALISCLSAEKGSVRAMPRAVWVTVILLVPLIGWLAWFFAGRPLPQRRPGGPAARPGRGPVAPDDDPDFLRTLAEQSRKQDNDLFRRWEDDLRGAAEPPAKPDPDTETTGRNDPPGDDDRGREGSRSRDGEPPRGEDSPEPR